MNDSLTMIVPARNAEVSLVPQIEHLLDVLPDLTQRFEIIIVDDASTDHTVEVARRLAAEYPQVRLIRHDEPQGLEAAAQTGARWAQGDLLLVREDSAPLSPADLRRLWSLRRRTETAAIDESSPGVFSSTLIEQLGTWGQLLRNLARGENGGGLRLLVRQEGGELGGRADAAHLPQRPRHTFVSHLRELALGE